MKVLQIDQLKKSFKSNFLIKTYRILKDINLSVDRGEIYGFLGPNGAGKTTTIKCVVGLISPDAGEISINGIPADRVESRKNIGFMAEQPYFYDHLTAAELLHFFGRLFSMPNRAITERTSELLNTVGLVPYRDIKVNKFSKGMVQRLGLAQTLLHDPDFIILDEPFSGLDPVGRKELRDIILSLKDRGKTIFFSSHILQDMELMVDKVGIIFDGVTRLEGSISQLMDQSVRYYEVVFESETPDRMSETGLTVSAHDQQFLTRCGDIEEMNGAIKSINSAGGRIAAVNPVKLTLEEIFLKEVSSIGGGQS